MNRMDFRVVPSCSPSLADDGVKRAQEPVNGPLFYRAQKILRKFTGVSRNATSGPVKFPDNGSDKLTGPEITGTFEKRAPGY